MLRKVLLIMAVMVPLMAVSVFAQNWRAVHHGEYRDIIFKDSLVGWSLSSAIDTVQYYLLNLCSLFNRG